MFMSHLSFTFSFYTHLCQKMDSHRSLSSLLLPFHLVCVLVIIGIPLSLSNTEFYWKCHDAEFKCGDITVGYPFFGGDREPLCGHPSLQLNCDHDDYTTTIEIADVEYQVLQIRWDDRSLKIARKDLIRNGTCSPQVANSTLSLDYKLFQMGDARELGHFYGNITLLYDRPPLTSPDFISFGCDKKIARGPRYENVSVKLGGNDLRMCSDSVTVPVLLPYPTGLIKDIFSSLPRVGHVLLTGFEVQWKTEDREACKNCTQSGGECGFDTRNQTACYCPFSFDNLWETTSCVPSAAPQARGSTLWINKKKSKVLLIVIGIAGVVAIFVLFSYLIFIQKKKWTDDQNVRTFMENYGPLASKRYSYSDVKKMTFKFKHKLGQGGYGSVYKGKLPDGKLMAVKVLSELKGNGEEFINEVVSTSRTSHVNVVKLVGFCYENSKRALICDYMPNGSLDRFIYADKKHQNTSADLEWRTLYQITLGIARGLEYLHQGCNTRILHFDIKPHNILLDEEFRPRISDFGLAKLCRTQESIVSMSVARGTLGYIAPEVYNRSFGEVSYKSDIYSFGMMVPEMAGGRRNVEADVSHASEIYFPHWIYKQLELGQDLKLHGVVTGDEEKMARKMIMVGLWCIQMNPSDRPSMTKVVEMLEGSLESLQTPPQPYFSSSAREQQIPSSSSISSYIEMGHFVSKVK